MLDVSCCQYMRMGRSVGSVRQGAVYWLVWAAVCKCLVSSEAASLLQDTDKCACISPVQCTTTLQSPRKEVRERGHGLLQLWHTKLKRATRFLLTVVSSPQ